MEMHKYIKAFMTCVTICCTANEAKKRKQKVSFFTLSVCVNGSLSGME